MPVNHGYLYGERVGIVPDRTTVLGYLSARYPHSTPAQWRARIAAGQVRVDGEPVRDPGRPLAAGMELAWERPAWSERPVPLDFAVLHRDVDLLAVAKPAGLPAMPGGGYLEHTLLAAVRERYPEASPMHRLGRWTSGVTLFARTAGARAAVARDWRRGSVGKRYRALASGAPGRDRFEVAVPIGPVPHALLGSVHAACPGGKPSRSTVTVLERRDGAFLAEVEIETGRPHQIRIHLAAAGYPLEGDPLYPAGGVPAPDATALPGDPGYRLHAVELRLAHPATGEPLTIRCAPPPALRRQAEPGGAVTPERGLPY